MNENVEWNYKIVAPEEVPELIALQKVAIARLELKDSLQPLTDEEFEYIVSGNEFIIGVYNDQKLIAFRAMLVPQMNGAHLGLDAGLQLNELSRVIYQELSIVHPGYRGKGLQTQMGVLAMSKVDRSRYDHVCATVAPFNIPSLKDKFALGLQIVALKQKYGGKLRYVFMKKLNDNPYADKTFVEERIIKMSDTLKQQQVLSEGYVGVSMHNETEWVVKYHRMS